MSAQEDRAYVRRAGETRRRNDRIADKADHLRFVARIPLLCECEDDDCREFVLVTLGDYRAARAAHRPLLAPGH